MASPAPSPRGTPSTLKDRSSEPLGDQQTTESCAVASEQEEQQRTTSPSRSSMLLLFVPAAAAATVSPLPPRVASRWSSEGGVSSIATQDSIDARLVAAEAKRQAFLQWVATRSAARQAARRGASVNGGESTTGTNLQNKLDDEASAAKMAAVPTTLEKEEGRETEAPHSSNAPLAHHRHRHHNDNDNEDPVHLHALSRLRAAAARRRLQRAWRSFHGRRSSELATAFVATGVLGGAERESSDGGNTAPSSPPPPPPAAAVFGVGSPSSSPPPLALRASFDGILASDFDDLASLLTRPATLRATRALLARCEVRVVAAASSSSGGGCAVAAAHGALAASFARRRSAGGSSASSSPAKKLLSPLPGGRYPLRVFLSSLMMVAHPEVVFRSANGEKERSLRTSAAELRAALCSLLAAMISGGGGETSSSSSTPLPRALAAALGEATVAPLPPSNALAAFDASWARFLSAFAGWRAADAAALEADLVRAAVELEGSRLSVEAASVAAAAAAEATPSPSSPESSPEAAPRPPPRRAASGADAAEVAVGVARDLDLLRSKARELGGEAAAKRLDAALEGCRAMARAASDALLLVSMSPPQQQQPSEREGAEANAAATVNDTNLLPSAGTHALTGSPILNLPSISRAPSGTLPAPSKTESVLWGLIKSGGEPVGMLRLAEAVWGDAADVSSSSYISVADVERATTNAEARAEAAAAAASAEIAASGVDDPGSSATDAAVAAARAADEARWARARLAFSKDGNNGNGGAALVAASALSTAARRIAGALGAGARASEAAHALRREYEMISLRDEFSISSDSVSSQSLIPGLDVERVLTRLEAFSETLRTLCAPARDAGHAAAAAASRAAVGAAFALVASAEGGADVPRLALATALAASLRRADAGARLLQADVAATEARALAGGANSSSSSSSATAEINPLAARARSLLRLRAALPASATEAELSAALPLTRAWLAEACGRLPVVEGALPAAPPPASASSDSSSDGDRGSEQRAAAAASAAGLPTNLRSGFSALSSTTSSSSVPSRAKARHELLLPAPHGGWRAALRSGLLSLVAAPTPLAPSAAAAAAVAAQGPPGAPVPSAVPEVVALEFAELRAAQHEFQLLAVCAAGVMLVRNARSNSSSNSSSSITPAEVRARLRALLADSATSTTLPDLAAELALLASSHSPSSSHSSPPSEAATGGGGPSPPSLEVLESEMRSGLGRLLRRGSPPFEALAGALETALAARLLRPPGASADAAAAAALARAGAGALAKDVEALAERVGRIAAVAESVFGSLVEHVVEGLL